MFTRKLRGHVATTIARSPDRPHREAGRSDERDCSEERCGVTVRSLDASDGPVTVLRGARANADVRQVRIAAFALCVAALVTSVVVLFVAGAEKNAQIDRLHQQGVPVEVTVSGCLGLMGGSGSNLAGYNCRASFALAGRYYSDDVPGSALYSPGTRLRAVVVPSDPALLSTPAVLAAEQASDRVFLVPTALLVVFGITVGALMIKRRRTRSLQRVR